ncbi:MAG: DUF1569 domain-containing protein [Phycisphaerales bacterium]
MAKATNWHPRDYASLADINAELDRFEAAHSAGTIRTTGNWSAGQILEHCAIPIRFSMDGFFDEQGKPVSFPWYIKMVGVSVFKPMLGRSHMKPGIKLPAEASSMLPEDQQDFEGGMARFREQMARLDAGEQMTKPSPLRAR